MSPAVEEAVSTSNPRLLSNRFYIELANGGSGVKESSFLLNDPEIKAFVELYAKDEAMWKQVCME